MATEPKTEDMPEAVMTLSENTSVSVVSDLQYYAYTRGTTNSGSTSYVVYCSNRYLTLSQMACNAKYILDFLRRMGWTKNAICGMLGNMQEESKINPGMWEGLQENNLKRGFGLLQWTPASKYIDWANECDLPYSDIYTQMQRILYELEGNYVQWIKTSKYPISFKSFTQSTESSEYLAAAFIYNYERPENYSTLSVRQEDARYWYENLI